MKVCLLAFAMLLLTVAVHAQQEASAPPPAKAPSSATAVLSDKPQVDSGHVKQASIIVSKPTDAQRRALTFTSYALEVHLMPREHQISVRARMTVRNDSAEPLPFVPLQLSSSLTWSSARVNETAANMDQSSIDSDADHTGKLNEAIVHLPAPLPPKGELRLDVFYSGSIPQDSTRLTRIGTPPELAMHTDWDEIAPGFTGLRGFGNVVWYPISSTPVALGEGNSFFREIGLTKLRESAATISISITDEAYGPVPTVAIIDGFPVPLIVSSRSTAEDLPTIVTCSLHPTPLGFNTPSLFLATRTAVAGNDLHLFARAADIPATQGYMTAASMVTPEMHQWLGAQPKGVLTTLDLEHAGDTPYEEGQALYTSFQSADPRSLADAMSHALAHAYFVSPRPWLDEGVPEFMAGLWTEQISGREAAITQLDSQRAALALVEPARPDTGAASDSGQPLVKAHDAIYYRTKAAYVLWMLRAIAGDAALASALHAYQPAQDTPDDYFQHLVEQSSGKKLDWFFQDWVYRDHGLPDLSIEAVFPVPANGPDSYLVAVTVANSGDAAAEVPVTVTSAEATATERVLVPARGRAVHRLLIQGRPEEVQVNDGTVPEVEASVHRTTLTHAP